ncbi:MAG TPA: metal-dependent hydrolase [Verrucomicrobiae bacterium]|jgi:inner membrane protein|nr:metal-dependent hydrolase [Verrucomicrobiae bacterium]
MEPVTHFMTGAVLSRAGFNRKAAYATLAMTLAAEAPDLDVLWSLKGPVAAFEHHRGWTHTLIGIPLEAAVVTGVIWLGHRLFARRRVEKASSREPSNREPGAPVRWGRLYWLSVVALLSHILLDWTNNYGVRPFFPFNPRWYAGSIIFIVEPVMFVLLLGALVAPALFGLVSSEVGARGPRYRGQGWAITALLGIVALWGLRFFERQKAMDLMAQSGLQEAQVVRVTADPFPVNPFRWQAVMETPLLYQVARVDTLSGDVSSNPQADVFYKPPSTLAALAAKRSWLGHVYLDWAQIPVVNDLGTTADGLTTVTFRDLRFIYGAPVFGRESTSLDGESTPLEGVVIVNGDRRVEEMRMDGHTQH